MMSRPVNTTRTRPIPRHSLWLLALVLSAAASAQTTSPTGQILVADFNNDGIPDTLVTSSASPSAFLSLGASTFGTFASTSYLVYTIPAQQTCGTGATVGTVIGDFNGDTYPDIVFNCVNTDGSPSSNILLGRGDGTFAAGVSPTGLLGTTLLAGDFNKDGKLDLVSVGGAAGSSGAIAFLAGNGDGTFAEAVYSQFGQTSPYTTAIAADINGDGAPEIVAGNFAVGAGTYTVDIFAFNDNGTFGASSGTTVTPTATAAVGVSPDSSDTQILAGNFFGNGAVDLAVVDTGPTAPGVFLLQNTSTANSYLFATAVKTAVSGIKSAQAASFTGSGTTDLLVATASTLSVLNDTGNGTFATAFSGLSVSATPLTYTAADANFDGYADIYLLSNTDAGNILSVDLLSGTATATSMPATLTPGTQPISAAWAGNTNFTGSTATGSVVVEGLTAATTTTLTSGLNPDPLGTPVPLTALVAPAAMTTQVPTGTVAFMDGDSLLGSSAVSTTGTATFSATGLTSGTHALTATYAGDARFAASTSAVLSEQVSAVAPPDVTLSGPPTTTPGQQPTLNFTLVNPYPAPLNGTFTLSFASSVAGRTDDPAVQFSSGGRALTFSIAANSVVTPTVMLQSGTLAGTITITLTLTSGGVNVTPANLAPVVITVPAAAPVLSAASGTSVYGGLLTVFVDGLSNTLEATTANFHFNSSNGGSISNPDVTVQVPSAFAQWFGSTASVPFGSAFTYTQQFTLSGSESAITSVDVTLTNSAGTSNKVTAPVSNTP